MKTKRNLEAIINKVERLYAEAAVLLGEGAFLESIEEIRMDLYWAYKDATVEDE